MSEIELRAQADEKRQQATEGLGLQRNRFVLPDKRWDAWFQALENQGVDHLADSSVGAARGLFSPTQPMGSTIFDPDRQRGLSDLEAGSLNALGARPSLLGRRRAGKGRR